MEAISGAAGGMGAEIVRGLLAVGWIAGSLWSAAKAYQWTNRRLAGWAAGLGVAVVLGVMLLPAHRALLEVTCNQSGDYRSCMDGD